MTRRPFMNIYIFILFAYLFVLLLFYLAIKRSLWNDKIGLLLRSSIIYTIVTMIFLFLQTFVTSSYALWP